MIYFDIGSYVGQKTAEYLFLSADMRVIAVEPNPVNAALLRTKFKDDNVIVVEKAVSDKIGTANLAIPSCNLTTLATLVPEKHFTGRFGKVRVAKTIEVQTTTLDALIAEYGKPRFIKIDVENSECAVLRGLSQPINLSFEYHSDFMDTLICCLRTARRLGKYACCFTWGESRASAYMPPHKMLQVLRGAVEENPDLWGQVYIRWE